MLYIICLYEKYFLSLSQNTSKHLEIMEDLRTIAYAIRPTADFLHDYMLRKFRQEGKDRSGSTPYRDKRNRRKKNKPRRK